MLTTSNVPNKCCGTLKGSLAASTRWRDMPGGSVLVAGNIFEQMSKPKLWDPGGRCGCSSIKKVL